MEMNFMIRPSIVPNPETPKTVPREDSPKESNAPTRMGLFISSADRRHRAKRNPAATQIAFGPQNRNFVGFYFDTGLVYTGLIPTRDEDQIGVGFVYAQLTNGARRTLELEGSRGVGAEMVLEFTCRAFLTPWLYIQPDAQLIINPGATQDLRNAFVLGGRVSINF